MNINGKVPEEEMYKHTPQKSFYEIDGGHPDFNTFYKPSMVSLSTSVSGVPPYTSYGNEKG